MKTRNNNPKWSIVASLVALLFAGSRAHADEVITFFQSAFLPTFVQVTTGEQVTFVWDSGSGNVPQDVTVESGGAPFLEFMLSASNPRESFLFVDAGSYTVTTSTTVLSGTISVQPFTVEVEVVDSSFEPENVYIFAGDRVRWFYSDALLHTLTSGAGPADPQNGVLFDEVFGPGGFDEFLFTFDNSGVQQYFCLPHFITNMAGSVTVQRQFRRGDANFDGSFGITDPLVILNYLFLNGPTPTCFDAYDCNDDGAIGLNDPLLLLGVLFVQGPPDSLPQPYPLPGPDRTDDNGNNDPADDNLCL